MFSEWDLRQQFKPDWFSESPSHHPSPHPCKSLLGIRQFPQAKSDLCLHPTLHPAGPGERFLSRVRSQGKNARCINRYRRIACVYWTCDEVWLGLSFVHSQPMKETFWHSSWHRKTRVRNLVVKLSLFLTNIYFLNTEYSWWRYVVRVPQISPVSRATQVNEEKLFRGSYGNLLFSPFKAFETSPVTFLCL